MERSASNTRLLEGTRIRPLFVKAPVRGGEMSFGGDGCVRVAHVRLIMLAAGCGVDISAGMTTDVLVDGGCVLWVHAMIHASR